MFEGRFTKEATAVLDRAGKQARAFGDPTIEVVHLLIAIAEHPVGPTVDAFARFNITEERVRDAVAAEFSDAVAVAGETTASGLMDRLPRKPKYGASVKLAMTRGITDSAYRGEKKIKTEHLLMGMLLAEAGVIPRVLRQLDVTAEELINALLPTPVS